MKMLALLPTVLLLVLELSRHEVPDFDITREGSKYKDFTFQVGFEQEKLGHAQFQIYDIIIAIRHNKRKNLSPKGYIEVWRDRQFIYSSSVSQTTEDSLRMTLKKTVEIQNALLFFFRMNPRYIEESWFNYQVLRDDGSVEMNCLIRLNDFIEGAPAENPPPARGGQERP